MMTAHRLSAIERFSTALRAYRLAKAELDLHCATVTPQEEAACDAYERETARLADNSADAINGLLLLPASTQFELATKLEISHQEQVWDGWSQAHAISAILACDAERLRDGELLAGRPYQVRQQLSLQVRA